MINIEIQPWAHVPIQHNPLRLRAPPKIIKLACFNYTTPLRTVQVLLVQEIVAALKSTYCLNAAMRIANKISIPY